MCVCVCVRKINMYKYERRDTKRSISLGKEVRDGIYFYRAREGKNKRWMGEVRVESYRLILPIVITLTDCAGLQCGG